MGRQHHLLPAGALAIRRLGFHGDLRRALASDRRRRGLGALYRRGMGLDRVRLDLGLLRPLRRRSLPLRDLGLGGLLRMVLGSGICLGTRLGDLGLHGRVYRLGAPASDFRHRGFRLRRVPGDGRPDAVRLRSR